MNSCELITDFCDFSEYDEYISKDANFAAFKDMTDDEALETAIRIGGSKGDEFLTKYQQATGRFGDKYDAIFKKERLNRRLQESKNRKSPVEIAARKAKNAERSMPRIKKLHKELQDMTERRDALAMQDITNRSTIASQLNQINALNTELDKSKNMETVLTERLAGRDRDIRSLQGEKTGALNNLAASKAAFEAYKNRGIKQRISDTWKSGTKGKLALGGAAAATAAVGTLAGLGIAGARGVGPMASDSAKAKRVERLIAEGNTAKAMQVANSIKSEVIRNAILSRYAAPALPSY